MIGIILLILKIIGIILLSIFALILLIILLLLFLPMKYYFIANKKDNFEIDTKFTWLFSIISVQYILRNGIDDFKVRIPFLNKLMADDEAEEINNNKRKKSDTKPLKDGLQTDTPASVHHISNAEGYEKIEYKTKKEIKILKKLNSVKEKLKSFIQRIKELIVEIIKYKDMAKQFDREFGIKKVFKISLIYLIKLLKALRLKKFVINGKIGFDNPADTGVVIGAIAMIRPYVPANINIDGDFNNKVFTGDIILKGRTNLLFVLIPVVKYILTEPVWAIIKKYWR